MSGDATTMAQGTGDLRKNLNEGVLSVQPDWDVAFTSKEDAVWVTFKPRGEKGCHGQLSRMKRTSSAWSGDENFRMVNWTPGGPLIVEHKATGRKAEFLAAQRKFPGIHLKSINCLDVSAGGLGVSACIGGEVKIWETDRGIVRRSLEGHVDQVTACKFFPSGLVIITGGFDMRLKIWSAETGESPVTLVGHGAAITGISIVERGRNVLSVSRDGSCRLWDVGETKCLHTYDCEDGVINSCDLKSMEGFRSKATNEISEREVGTDGKVLAVGCETGKVSLIDVRGREVNDSLCVGDAVNCVRWAGVGSTEVLAVGGDDGRLLVFDPRQFHASKPLQVLHDSASPILSLLGVNSVRRNVGEGILVGRRDGTCCMYGSSVMHNSPGNEASVPLHLTGSDCDPIYGLASADAGETVFTASRDGFIRRYNLKLA